MSPIPTRQDPAEEFDTINATPADYRMSVLVVGAGPTGLLLASELQRRGVPCHLIDARPGPNHWDRATVVHPRTLQSSSRLVVEKLLDVGCRQRVVKIHSGGKELKRLQNLRQGIKPATKQKTSAPKPQKTTLIGE